MRPPQAVRPRRPLALLNPPMRPRQHAHLSPAKPRQAILLRSQANRPAMSLRRPQASHLPNSPRPHPKKSERRPPQAQSLRPPIRRQAHRANPKRLLEQKRLPKMMSASPATSLKKVNRIKAPLRLAKLQRPSRQTKRAIQLKRRPARLKRPNQPPNPSQRPLPRSNLVITKYYNHKINQHFLGKGRHEDGKGCASHLSSALDQRLRRSSESSRAAPTASAACCCRHYNSYSPDCPSKLYHSPIKNAYA